MGPLASLFGQLMDQRRSDEANALRARLGADDPGGTIYLDEPPPQSLPRQYTGPIDWLFNKPPAAPTPSFRGPEMDVGPAPPTDRAPLARMFKDKK